MAKSSKQANELVRQIIREVVSEEIKNIARKNKVLLEGTIDATVIEPLLNALKTKDREKISKIYKMSLSQFSPEEINDAIISRINKEKEFQNRTLLKAMKGQYGAGQPRSVAQQSAIDSTEAELEMKRKQMFAGSGQPSFPSRQRLVAESEGKIRNYVRETILKQLAETMTPLPGANKPQQGAPAAGTAPAKSATPNAPTTAPAASSDVDQEVNDVQDPDKGITPKPKQKAPAAVSESLVRNLVQTIVESELRKTRKA